MTQSLYLIGEPGAGKTTLMTALCQKFQVGEAARLNRLLWGEPLRIDNHLRGYRLGRTRNRFSGTDALGMAVCPDAIAWVKEEALPEYVLGEGARLATPKFLDVLSNKSDFTLIHVTADNAAERRLARGSNQNETWIRGRITQTRNLIANNPQWRIVTIDNTYLSPTENAEIVWGNV